MSGRTLVISPNWIGDAVMSQPLLRLLKDAHPGRPIDVLAPPSAAPVWRAMVEVAEVLETPFRHGALQLKERRKYAKVLKARGYTDAYVLPNTLKYALIPWLAGIPQRVGYKGEMRYGLINVMHHDDQPPRPMVPFYAALAGDPKAPLRTDVPRPAMQVAEADQRAAREAAGIPAGVPLLVFAPGAEFGPAKRWPARHFAALANSVREHDANAHIALLGSPKDREAGDEVLALAGTDRMHNLAGATSLAQAIALIAQADGMVANDSGLLHIASALNRPVVALYGSTDPDHAPPFSDRSASLSMRLPCSPCKQRECPLGHHDCMETMEAPLVWQALVRVAQ